jgi:hypothetical protein
VPAGRAGSSPSSAAASTAASSGVTVLWAVVECVGQPFGRAFLA